MKTRTKLCECCQLKKCECFGVSIKPKPQHTLTPWKIHQPKNQGIFKMPEEIWDGKGVDPIAIFGYGKVSFGKSRENAAFIVKAVNSHEALINASKRLLKAYEADFNKSPYMFIANSWNTNGIAIEELKKAIIEAEGGK